MRYLKIQHFRNFIIVANYAAIQSMKAHADCYVIHKRNCGVGKVLTSLLREQFLNHFLMIQYNFDIIIVNHAWYNYRHVSLKIALFAE